MKILTKNLKLRKDQFGVCIGTSRNYDYPETTRMMRSIFGTWRTNDYPEKMFWYDLEPEPGVYKLKELMWIIREAIDTQTRIMWTIYGCPYFYAKYKTQPLGVSPYGTNGGALGRNSPPADPKNISNLIIAVLDAITRLKGGQRWLDEGKLIIENSNEVNWSKKQNTDGQTRFRVKDMAALFDDQKAIYTTAKTFNANITIAAPSLTSLSNVDVKSWEAYSGADDMPENFFNLMMAQTDGIKSFADYCDLFNFHLYGSDLLAVQRIDLIRSILKNNGLQNCRFIDSESGKNASNYNPLADQETVAKLIVRNCFLPLLLGAEIHCEFMLGYPSTVTQAYSLMTWPLALEKLSQLIPAAEKYGVDKADLDLTTGQLTMSINGVSAVY